MTLDSFAHPLSHKAELFGRLLATARLGVADSVYVGDRAEGGDSAHSNGLCFAWALLGFGNEAGLGENGQRLALPDHA